MIDENFDEEIKISRYSFNSFKIERSIRDLLSLEERNKIVIPEFQRNFVWDYKQCCKFIESLLLGLPVPDLFLFRDRENNNERFVLIDGLQRFTCIKQFVKGHYDNGTIHKLFKINLPGSEWNGFTYNSLSPEDRDIFDDYSLKFNVFDSVENNEATKKLYMTEIFERINTGSAKLTDQEIRNAVYNGDLSRCLKDVFLTEKKLGSIFAKRKYSERGLGEEFILRCLTYYQITQQLLHNTDMLADKTNIRITGSKKTMLSQYMYLSNIQRINYCEHIKIIKDVFDFLRKYDSSIFLGVSEERKGLNNSFHEVTAEAIIVYFMINGCRNFDLEYFNKKKIEFWCQTEKIDNPFYWSTTNKKTIIDRFETVGTFIE